MMNPKGNVLINKEFVHTKNWPGEQFTMNGVVDLEQEYKKALAGKMVTVMDIATDDSGYLVLAEGEKCGQFIWHIEKGDTAGFIPVIKKHGVLIPAGLNPFEETIEIVKNQHIDMKFKHEADELRIFKEWNETKDMPRKKKKRKRKELLLDYSIWSWADKNMFAMDYDWDVFTKFFRTKN